MNIEVKISNKPISYKKALYTLEKRVSDVEKGIKNELIWILEHPTIYTAGIRSNSDEILDKKINIVKTNRGGKITLHSPGQKIVYFVINLNKRKKDIRLFIKTLETSLIQFLKIYKINAKSDRKNIGIWVNNKKISAIGIRVKKWIAYHGCSININNDIRLYENIIPCGLNNKQITSLKDLKIKNFKNINQQLKIIFLNNLSKI